MAEEELGASSNHRNAVRSMTGLRGKSAVVYHREPLWLDALVDLLECAGAEVVGRASEPRAASAMVGEHHPDVLVAGVEFDGTDELGVECVRHARRHPTVKPVVIGETRRRSAIDAAFAAGAVIYCVKTADKDDLASAVRQAFEHSIFIAETPLPTAEAAQPTPIHETVVDLTRREVEILRLVAEGHPNAQLAALLRVTEQTVKFHLSNIYRKLDAANRTEASRWAQLNGLLSATRPPLIEPVG